MSAPVFRGQPATLIVNPAAAGGRVGREWTTLEARIREALGDSLQCVWTERQGHGVELARDAVTQGSKTVISLGGDGTFLDTKQLLASSPGSARASCARRGR